MRDPDIVYEEEEREKRKRVDGPTEKTSPKTLQAPSRLLRAKIDRVQGELSRPVHRRPGDERTGRGGNGLEGFKMDLIDDRSPAAGIAEELAFELGQNS